MLAGRTVTLADDDSLPITGGVPIVVDGMIVGPIGAVVTHEDKRKLKRVAVFHECLADIVKRYRQKLIGS